jgi:hypothetical protein
MTDLAALAERRRCKAKVSYGTTWEAGRRQCRNYAVQGSLCRVHALKEHHRARAATTEGEVEGG